MASGQRPSAATRTSRSRTFRQDVSFIVGALLLLTVAVAALTALDSDEAEFFGLSDDLHELAGWAVVALAALHTVLCGGQMVRHAKRRWRRLLGVGGVIEADTEWGGQEDARHKPGQDGTN
jgi:hypothetical protein